MQCSMSLPTPYTNLEQFDSPLKSDPGRAWPLNLKTRMHLGNQVEGGIVERFI